MRAVRFATSRFVLGLGILAGVVGLQALTPQLPLQPPRASGESITAALEGWFANGDGSFTVLLGYFNRNTQQTLDIPVGPDNRIEPGGPDYGQPTHFLPRRQWGVFGIRVPADFGNRRLTWTIVANGKTTSVPVGLVKGYQVEPFKEMAQGNEPPKLRLDPAAPALMGPPRGIAAIFTATVGQPLTLDSWASDDGKIDPESPPAARRGPPITVVWSKYRGSGAVTFSEVSPAVDLKADGKASTTATFAAPGEYMLRIQVNDQSGDGGGGNQCCWTNAHVKVTVTAAGTWR